MPPRYEDDWLPEDEEGSYDYDYDYDITQEISIPMDYPEE
jgi:hypothetical protein